MVILVNPHNSSQGPDQPATAGGYAPVPGSCDGSGYVEDVDCYCRGDECGCGRERKVMCLGCQECSILPGDRPEPDGPCVDCESAGEVCACRS